MIEYSEKEKRDIIMNHYSKPLYFSKNPQGPITTSDSCADKIWTWMINGLWMWSGDGCAIFKSSTDIFIEFINNGAKLQESIFKYKKIVQNGQKYEELKKLNVFSNVQKHLNRVDCALLVIKSIEKNI